MQSTTTEQEKEFFFFKLADTNFAATMGTQLTILFPQVLANL